jgi:hypothetical protein
LENLGILVGAGLNIGFVFWSLRRGYDLDEKLTYEMKRLRWGIVAFGIVIGSIPGLTTLIRAPIGIIGLVFMLAKCRLSDFQAAAPR